jgi:hypothetical protein
MYISQEPIGKVKWSGVESKDAVKPLACVAVIRGYTQLYC